MIVEDTVPLAPTATTGIGHDREWWAKEAAARGSDWAGVIRTALAVLAMAGLIAPEPSTFQQACEQADRRRQDISPRRVAPRNRPAPKVTVDALMFSLRRGVNELAKPDSQRQLSALDRDQLKNVCRRVQAFQPAIARPWSADAVAALISTWKKPS
jgi:hypothetical protein